MYRSYLDSNHTHSIKTVGYFDGLGRETYSVSDGVSGDGSCVYTGKAYDSNNRECAVSLPVSHQGYNAPTDLDDYLSWLGDAYQDNHAYSITEYDALDRPVSISTPGDVWNDNDKKKTVEYITNSANNIRYYYTVGLQDTVLNNNVRYYPAATLTGEKYIDEDGHTKTIFKDKTGKVILERLTTPNSARGAIDTYYVYSYSGLLRFVLTPKFQNERSLNKYAYIYKYDSMNRCSEKKLPGCEPTIFRYDVGNKAVITQDPLLREKSLYRFTLYDKFGRLAIQGTCSGYSIDDTKNARVSIDTSANGICNTGYILNDNTALTLTEPSLEIAYYYDSHIYGNQMQLLGCLCYSELMPSNSALSNSNGAKGNKTYEVIATSNGERLYSTFYYDARGRCVEDRHTTINGEVYKVYTEYSFTDKPTSITKVIPYVGRMSPAPLVGSNTSVNEYSITTTYTYNTYNDQLASISLKFGNNAPMVVSSYTYDNLGRMQSNSRADIGDLIHYNYDLHGWMKEINGNHFTENLYYADAPDFSAPCYNGNISAQTWNVADGFTRGYAFSYNQWNMLHQALYAEARSDAPLVLNNKYIEGIDTDSYGNIIRLMRYGKNNSGNYSGIDALGYQYDGMKVIAIGDSWTNLSYNNAFEYADRNKTATTGLPDFTYNTAGMLTSDLDKKVERICYNNIALVDSIIFQSGAKVNYEYAMSGEKLKVSHSTHEYNVMPFPSASTLSLPSIPSYPRATYDIKEYIGDDVEMEYSETFTGTMYISSFARDYKYHFGDGYVKFYPATDAAPQFYYYSKDHLGNIRSVVTKDPETNAITEVQQTHYYPFGGIIADLGFGRNEQNRLYNGKELDTSNNLWWYDYGARQYDATRGQFVNYDWHCENYYSINPLTYCHNRPNMLIDPNGMDDYFDSNGQFVNRTESGSAVLMMNNGDYMSIANIDFSRNTDAIANIGRHYMSKSDTNDFTISVANVGSDIPVGAAFSYNIKTNGYELYLNGGYVNVGLTNCYDFECITFHETRHRYDETTLVKGTGEANAIIQTAMSCPSWERASNAYKTSQAFYAVNYMNTAMLMGNAQNTVSELNRAFNGMFGFEIIDNKVEVCLPGLEVTGQKY